MLRVVREGKPGRPQAHSEALWTTCPPDQEPEAWEWRLVQAREEQEHEERLEKRALRRGRRAPEAPEAPPAPMTLGPCGEQAVGPEVPPQEQNDVGAVHWDEGGIADFFLGGGEEEAGEVGEVGGGGGPGEDGHGEGEEPF